MRLVVTLLITRESYVRWRAKSAPSGSARISTTRPHPNQKIEIVFATIKHHDLNPTGQDHCHLFHLIMALRNTTRKTTALVPAAAPVIVEALRAGPLTTQELWAKCISDSVQNAGSSQQAGEGGSSGADKLGLHEVFRTKK